MLSLRAKVIAITTLVAIVVFSAYSYYLYNKGEKQATTTVVTNQLKQENKTRKAYEKIDSKTPFDADKSVAVEWLYQHATSH